MGTRKVVDKTRSLEKKDLLFAISTYIYTLTKNMPQTDDFALWLIR